jgi:hypothetical protein
MRAPPISTIPHQGVEDRKQLPHARHQRNLLRLTRAQESLVELLDGGVVAGSDQSAHVQDRPHRSPSSPRLALAAPLAGVAVEGGDSHQCTQTPVGDLSKLWQFGQEGSREDSPDSRDAPEESLVGFEGGVLLNGTVKVPIDALDLLLKPLDVRPDRLGERLRSHLQTIVLGDEHLDELTPPGEDALQSDGFLLGDDAGSWFDRLGESGEDEGIYLVGLGELANRFGEVSGLARVNDGHGDRAGGEHRGGEALVSACGLHDGQFDARPFKPREHLLDALLIVAYHEGLAALLAIILAQDTHLEGALGNVDAYIDFSLGTRHWLSPSSSIRPGLADTSLPSAEFVAGSEALATVRAPPKLGRDDECFHTVSGKPGPRRERSVAPLSAAL